MTLPNRKPKWYQRDKSKKTASGTQKELYQDMALDSEVAGAKFKKRVGMELTEREEALLDHEAALRRKKRRVKVPSQGEVAQSSDE